MLLERRPEPLRIFLVLFPAATNPGHQPFFSHFWSCYEMDIFRTEESAQQLLTKTVFEKASEAEH